MVLYINTTSVNKIIYKDKNFLTSNNTDKQYFYQINDSSYCTVFFLNLAQINEKNTKKINVFVYISLNKGLGLNCGF